MTTSTPMTEFDIIKNYFNTQTEHRQDVRLGIGDDAAIVSVPDGKELIITTDTLISGTHFPNNTLPYDIGYKALAVNLSDLAAMGATPAWATLAITLPNNDEAWIQSFCDGFFTLANRHQVQLIGGDLTRGALSITVQALGFTAKGAAILRSGAKPNDLIYVSGTLGDAGLALAFLQEKIELNNTYQSALLLKLHRPEPRIAIGEALQGLAHACIDISDGLAADLTHILEQSQVGAILHVDQLPFSDELKHTLSHDDAIKLALTAGDDYELCFTVPPNKKAELEKNLSQLPYHYTCIGEITEQAGLDLRYQDGKKYHGPQDGYQHF